jgi:hypothetical protein
MKMKTTAIVLVLGIAIAVAAAMRTTNRADAAAGNCYADTKGPSEPTVCS